MVKKSKILAVLLAFAMVVTFMPFTALNVDAASKGKVKMVTQVTSDDGSVVKYSYNKKGLVSKIVSTWGEKGSDSDSYETSVTTFSYNKKNRITTKVTKTSFQNIEYKMDRTTGKRILGTEENVVTTTTTVENFVYNNKGLATQSVRTSTTVKSGSEVYDSETTTYKDNGNGTYTETYIEKGEKPSVYVRSDKKVTTINYSYDKKKRVSSAAVSEVDSYSSTHSYTDSGKTYAYTSERSDTNVYTEAYAYGKKNRMKKMTTYNPGVENSTDKYILTVNGKLDYSEVEITANGQRKTITTDETGKSETKIDSNYKNRPEPTNLIQTFKYDKKGNLKTIAATGSETEWRTVYNETTGQPTYDASGKIVKQLISYLTSRVTNYDNTVKKGSNRISKQLAMTTSQRERARSAGYGLSGRVVYKVKAKKASDKKSAEKQQWMIQNGPFAGVVGL